MIQSRPENKIVDAVVNLFLFSKISNIVASIRYCGDKNGRLHANGGHFFFHVPDNTQGVEPSDYWYFQKGEHEWLYYREVPKLFVRFLFFVFCAKKHFSEFDQGFFKIAPGQFHAPHANGINPENFMVLNDMFENVLTARRMLAPIVGENEKRNRLGLIH